MFDLSLCLDLLLLGFTVVYLSGLFRELRSMEESGEPAPMTGAEEIKRSLLHQQISRRAA